MESLHTSNLSSHKFGGKSGIDGRKSSVGRVIGAKRGGHLVEDSQSLFEGFFVVIGALDERFTGDLRGRNEY